MASEQQISRLPWMLAVKITLQQISLTNRHTRNSPPTNGGNDELEPNTADFKVVLGFKDITCGLGIRMQPTFGLVCVVRVDKSRDMNCPMPPAY